MKIGIFGFGAVGNAIYNELQEYNDLYVLVDKDRYDRYTKSKFIINKKEVYPKFITEGVMDVIFIALKNYDLDTSLPSIKPFISSRTILIPMMNGITAHDVIKEKYPLNRVLYGAINVEANKNGYETNCGRIYNLQFGDEYNYPVRSDLMDIRRVLSKYKIHNHIYANMKRQVWLKWMLNMGINQVSAILNASYREMANDYIVELFRHVFDEVYQVSLAYNIGIDKEDVNIALSYINTSKNSDRVTSLTLDVQNLRKNEIDYFGGTLIDLANKKNIDVPYNKTLYALLKLLDARIK